MLKKVRRTYAYRLYDTRHNKHLHHTINIAGMIWNHLTALQKRYYRLFGKHISAGKLKAHIAKLRRDTQRFGYWQTLHSQTVQDVCERHERAYQRFFKKKGGLPRFKKVKKYRSFTLKQPERRLFEEEADKKYRRIRIGDKTYKFEYHRPLKGTVKTVTIKRDAAGRLWIYFSVMEEMDIPKEASTGQSGGFDFGLRQFLTSNEGDFIDMPLFYTADLPRLCEIQSRVWKKEKDSHNRQAGMLHLARRHIRTADKRRDFHFQLAHGMCDNFDIMIFEKLNIASMKRLWGRKVSDLGFSQFLTILKWVAFKRGKKIFQIDRWARTTGKCSNPKCRHEQNLDLNERIFCCEKCGLTLDRDHNAAINIHELGHQLMLSQSEENQGEDSSPGLRR